MDVEIQANHDKAGSGSLPRQGGEPDGQWRLTRFGGGLFGALQLVTDLTVDLFLMIEVIGQGGMDFRERKVRELAGDFLRSPCVGHMIHHNLCHTDARPAFEARGASGFLKDMRILEGGCHGISVFQEAGGVKRVTLLMPVAPPMMEEEEEEKLKVES